MIIKELFNQVTFEELCPQLKSYVKLTMSSAMTLSNIYTDSGKHTTD